MASSSSSSLPISTVPRTVQRHHSHNVANDESRGSPSPMSSNSNNKSKRPKLVQRMSSSTNIVPRDTPNIQLTDEEYGPGDARAMSPRRSSEEVDRLGEKARQALIQQAKELQDSLLQIVDKVESVKSEHEKLEGGNRFLQSYIGELMQTSKITSSGAGRSKGKGKSSKW